MSAAIFTVILLTAHIAITVSKKLDFTNIVCNSSDNFCLKFENCHLKAVNRSYNYISVIQKMNQVHFKNFVVHMQSVKKASGWRPWLYNFTVNICRFINGPNKPVIKFFLGLVSADFDFVDNCSAKNRTLYSIQLSNTNVHKGLNGLPLPSGEYGVFSTWKSKNVQFTINLFVRYDVYTGTVALVFTAIGVLVSGIVVSRKKPRARLMAGWNATVGFVTVIGLLSYSLIGCTDNERGVFVESYTNNLGTPVLCARTCRCDYVSYAPVCGENNLTYISACHAGCKSQQITTEGHKIYSDCDCVTLKTSRNSTFNNVSLKKDNKVQPLTGGIAKPGACAVNCFKSFLIFLSVMCFLKFIGATTRANYFLIQVRSVTADDKAVALAFGMVMMSLLSFVPSPIFFGWLLDRMCLVWGKTCTEKGNCWLYDSHSLRYTLNWTASSFVFMGALCDCTVWYLVKNLKIFEDDKKRDEEKIASNKELTQLNCNI